MKKRLTDQELVEMLQAGGRLMEDAARHLLHDGSLEGKVIAFVRARGGSIEDAEDVFIEGISQLVINVRNNKFDQKSKLSTYLQSICYFMWYDRFKKQQKQEKIKEKFVLPEITTPSPEELFILSETTTQLAILMDQLSEDHQQVLSLWSLGYSLKEIAELTIYKDERVVAKTKSNCIKNLKNLVLANPYWDKSNK